jgi:hypothetical protein
MSAILTDFIDLEGVGGKDAVREQIRKAKRLGNVSAEDDQGRAGDRWEAADPFGRVETPEIPADLLPGVFGKFAGTLAESLQVSVSMPVMLCLGVLSACLQRKFIVSPFGDDYSEQCCIWVNVLSDSGERKSAVLKPMLAAIILWETKRNRELEPEIAEADTLHSIAQRRTEKLQADAAKEDSAVRRAELVREISELREQMPKQKVPVQLFTGDTSVEELQNLLVKHDGRMAVLATEGGIFAILAGLYSGGETYLDVALQSYSGDPVRVNRGSRTVIVERPAVTFDVCVQPGLIQDMAPAAKRKFRSSGLLARFFWAWPASSIGRRDMGKRGVISPELTGRYRAAVLGLLDEYGHST